MSKIVKGVARAFSDKRGWWGICLSTPDGDMWISPGIRSDQPCPATKGQVVTAEVEGAFNKVVGSIKVESVSAHTVAPVNKPQQQSGFKPRNNYGTQVGHAINGAFDLLGFTASMDDITDAAFFIVEKTNELKAVYAANNPALSDYDIGASVGHAIRNAAKIIQAREWDAERIIPVALSILEKINPAVLEYVQELDKPKEAVKTAPVTAPEPAVEVQAPQPVAEAAQEAIVVVQEETQPAVEAVVVEEETPVEVTKPKPVRAAKAKQEVVVTPPPVVAETQTLSEENLDDDLPW